MNIAIKYSQLKRVLFLILDYVFCFLCLFATLLIITFPIFSDMFTEPMHQRRAWTGSGLHILRDTWDFF